jgi:ATP-dependent RNA helicase DeaD
VFAVYGGQPIFKQIDGLKAKPQIIVGTPGRILDHINRRTLKLESTSMLVLDEADEMLKMGFKEDIEQITQKLAGRRQNVLASATMNNEIKALTQKFLNNPTVINAGGANSPAKTIAQEYVTLTPKHKKQHLLGMLQQFDGTALVFCNTKRMVDDLNKFLNEQNIPSRALHGDMRQSERTRVMNAFKSEKVNILVATDVAARGIDVNNITYVINYDYPEMEEYYIHRIGRTGRAGKQGKAYTFITTNLQMQNLMQLSKKIDFTITKSELSEAVEFKKGQQNKPRTRFNQRGATNNQNKKQSGSSKQYSKNNKDAKNSKNSSYNKDTKKSNKTSYNKDSKNSPYSKKEQTKTTSKQKNKTQSFSKSKKEQRKETPQTKQNQTTGFEKFMKKNKKKR